MEVFGQQNTTVNELVNPGNFHFRSFNVKNSSCIAQDPEWQVYYHILEFKTGLKVTFREGTPGIRDTHGVFVTALCVAKQWAGSGPGITSILIGRGLEWGRSLIGQTISWAQ